MPPTVTKVPGSGYSSQGRVSYKRYGNTWVEGTIEDGKFLPTGNTNPVQATYDRDMAARGYDSTKWSHPGPIPRPVSVAASTQATSTPATSTSTASPAKSAKQLEEEAWAKLEARAAALDGLSGRNTPTPTMGSGIGTVGEMLQGHGEFGTGGPTFRPRAPGSTPRMMSTPLNISAMPISPEWKQFLQSLVGQVDSRRLMELANRIMQGRMPYGAMRW